MIETCYTREQPDDLERRKRGLGAGPIHQTESEWSQLIAMLELVQRWQELMGDFTGEDARAWSPASAYRWPYRQSASSTTG